MGSHKLTGVADPTNAQDAATKNYTDTKAAAVVQSAAPIIGTTGGSSDAITASFTPTITALTAGLTVLVRATAANTTTIPTFQADATAAKTIVKGANSALVANNIPGAGYWMNLTYDLTLDKWILNNPAIVQPASPVSAAFKNLSIKVASNTTVTCAVDFVTMTDGTNFLTLPVSGTVNLGTNGAVNALDTGTIATNTFYAMWAVAKADGTQGWLASTSATAPTMPTGYTYKARMGWVKTINASATLYGTWQLGRRVQFVVGLAQTSILPLIAQGPTGTYSTTAPTWATPVVNGGNVQQSFVPSTASEIILAVTNVYKGGTLSSVSVAPSNSYAGYQNASGNIPAFDTGSTPNIIGVVPFSLILESTSIAVTAGNNGGAVLALGWLDNI